MKEKKNIGKPQLLKGFMWTQEVGGRRRKKTMPLTLGIRETHRVWGDSIAHVESLPNARPLAGL